VEEKMKTGRRPKLSEMRPTTGAIRKPIKVPELEAMELAKLT
jgi:hypothetical protein